jgi:ligand-binding SRPBCC domain-containing protein
MAAAVHHQEVITERFIKRSRIAASAEAVFHWHALPGAFVKLSPPWEPVELIEQTGGIRDGARVTFRIRVGPFRVRWIAEHHGYIENRQFQDVQVQGPFAKWEHTHLMEPDGPGACYLEDRVEYALPLGVIGRLFGGALTRRKLTRLFEYRHRITAEELESHGVRKG